MAAEPKPIDPTLPTLTDLSNGAHLTPEQFDTLDVPAVQAHLARCALCRRLADAGDPDPLPNDLVTESAFRWPGDPLAVGGMAVVFEGEDKRLGRKVILKTPREDDELSLAMNQMFQKRLETEARVLARLQHPSIVTIYEVGRSTTGMPFCVLERVEGISLRTRLDELAAAEADDGRPRTRARLELLSNLVSIAEAMAYAHERGIVHRDLNPNNILVGQRGEATLIDWGIAKDTGFHPTDSLKLSAAGMRADMPSSTITAGTPPYVCYAQAQGLPAQPSFDVYSFGMVIYEVVSGKIPYEWNSGRDAAEQLASLDKFLRWADRGPELPAAAPSDPELSGIIARAVTRDIEQRFTADELVRALKQYLTGELVFSHRYSLSGRLGRWVRRRRGLAISIGVSAIALVASALIGLAMRAQTARIAQERAQLATMAAAAESDAAHKQAEAAKANAEAIAADSRAAQAEREGKNAQVLRSEADAKRRVAETKRGDAEAAAHRAEGDASDALKRWQEAQEAQAAAEKARDDARAAQSAALSSQKDAEQKTARALAAKSAAEDAQADAVAAQKRADALRVDADHQRATALAEKDKAVTERAQAVANQEQAIAEKAEIERQREQSQTQLAEAKRKLAELEARIHQLEGASPQSAPQ